MKNKRKAPQFLKVKEVDRENFRIHFVFSSPVVDRHGEVIDQKGWRLENYMQNPVVLWGHDQSKFPIAKAENMTTESGNLEGDVLFAYNENPEAAIAFELCAGGFLNAGSVGFENIKWMYDDETEILTLLENELYEFSIVNVPANPEALSKAIDELKEKNVDKTVIENIVKFQATAKKNAEDRFKNLGTKVEDGGEEEHKDEVVADPKKPEGGEDTDEHPAEVEPAPTVDEPTEEAVKSALEVLFKSDREIIKASVKELTIRLNDAKGDIVVDEPAKASSKKGYKVSHVNALIRSLLKANSVRE